MTRAAPAPLPETPPKPNARKYVHILHDVAARHGLSVNDITGASRSHKFVPARHEAFYLLRLAGYSMLQIGQFCNRDHTTVMHGSQKHEAKLKGEAK
jgi:chromosomal replication initiation ATPase DnaA